MKVEEIKEGSPAEAVAKKYGCRNVIEMEKKLAEIRKERRELRTKLDEFQRNFVQTNNRKIRYTNDIKPVQGDFKRYKDLKGEVQQLEQAIASVK